MDLYEFMINSFYSEFNDTLVQRAIPKIREYYVYVETELSYEISIMKNIPKTKQILDCLPKKKIGCAQNLSGDSVQAEKTLQKILFELET